MHQPSIGTFQSHDLAPPRLERSKPWNIVSLLRQYTWRIKHSYTTLLRPVVTPDGRQLNSVFSVYIALAVLQREAHCVWTYVNTPLHAADGYRHMLGPWRLGIVYRWMHHATACLVRCSEAFRDVLRPRVAVACTKALIGVCSVWGSACVLTRMRIQRSCTDFTPTISA